VNKQAASVREGLERLLPRLWRFCHVLTGDLSMADDLAQSACQRALEREAQFRPETPLSGADVRRSGDCDLKQGGLRLHGDRRSAARGDQGDRGCP
jgi:hypothetical protein